MAENQTFDQAELHISPLDEVDGLDLRDFLINAQEDFLGDSNLVDRNDPIWFRQFSAAGLVARYHTEIVGYLLGAIPYEGPAYINLVAARSDFRHKGIGRRLYEQFITNAQQLGLTRVQATTVADNTDAISFHASMGFSGEIIDDYAGPGDPRVLFNINIAE